MPQAQWGEGGFLRISLDDWLSHRQAVARMDRNESPIGGPLPDLVATAEGQLPDSREASKESVSKFGQIDLLILDEESPFRLTQMGELHREQGRLREAESCLRKAATLVELLGNDGYDRMYVELQLGQVIVESGRPVEGEELLRRAAAIAAKDGRVDLGTRSLIYSLLAKSLAAQGKSEESDRSLAEAKTYQQELMRFATEPVD